MQTVLRLLLSAGILMTASTPVCERRAYLWARRCFPTREQTSGPRPESLLTGVPRPDAHHGTARCPTLCPESPGRGWRAARRKDEDMSIVPRPSPRSCGPSEPGGKRGRGGRPSRAPVRGAAGGQAGEPARRPGRGESRRGEAENNILKPLISASSKLVMNFGLTRKFSKCSDKSVNMQWRNVESPVVPMWSISTKRIPKLNQGQAVSLNDFPASQVDVEVNKEENEDWWLI
ncbi:uncharacterized protein LOC126640430 isoform X2 [Myiozetetes cayanensis]|uniref:uncharacterized protein LOC126640430 isoform X2 n=1 Tax=Myiozetetes cayanensis TaxID=478635 RepID=UPI00215EA2E6|nr:uncharacterized protein LOC126640430 isoform X2 [Myiozetetes cayanensis]